MRMEWSKPNSPKTFLCCVPCTHPPTPVGEEESTKGGSLASGYRVQSSRVSNEPKSILGFLSSCSCNACLPSSLFPRLTPLSLRLTPPPPWAFPDLCPSSWHLCSLVSLCGERRCDGYFWVCICQKCAQHSWSFILRAKHSHFPEEQHSLRDSPG